MPGGSGYGKTMTALRLGTKITEMVGGRVALLDTEKGSASLYAANPGEIADGATRFDFDAADLDAPFVTGGLVEAIYDIAASPDHTVLIIDSLSHFWFAKGGILDQAHMIETSTKLNGFQAIGKAKTQHYYPLVECIIAAPIHIIVTLRSKNAYDIGKTANNRTTISRIGEAPRFEESFLYELDLSLVMGKGNIMTVDKTRYTPYTDQVVKAPTGDFITPFMEWLSGGAASPYVYGDGTEVASVKARRIFNEYRAAHGDKVPETAEALKNWHNEQKSQ